MIRNSYPNREEWLQGTGCRHRGLGCGCHTGDIPMGIQDPAMGREDRQAQAQRTFQGSRQYREAFEEPIIREQFIQDHPEFLVDYHEFDILSLKRKPFINATLDGELLYMGPSYDVLRRTLNPGCAGCWRNQDGFSQPRRGYLDAGPGIVVPSSIFHPGMPAALVPDWEFALGTGKAVPYRCGIRTGQGRKQLPIPKPIRDIFLHLGRILQ